MIEATQPLSAFQLAVLWGCVLAAVAVFALMVHSIATFRSLPEGTNARRRSRTEVFWALVPIVIVAASAAPAVTGMLGESRNETVQQTRPAPGPELAGEIPQKPFQDGPIPL